MSAFGADPIRAWAAGEAADRWVLAGAGFAVFFAKIWRGPLGGDESCYALLSREILRRGDWAVLHHPAVAQWSSFYEHPPLYMWMTALNFELFGVGDTAAKLFSAICGWLTLGVVYAAARRIGGHRFAVVAGTVLVTSLYFVDYARKARLEIPLAFFLFLSFACILRAVQERSLGAATVAGLAMGAGLLTKGVPAAAGVAVAGLTLWFCGPAPTSWRGRGAMASAFLMGAGLLVVPWVGLQFAVDEGRFFEWYANRQVAWSVAGRDVLEPTTSVGFYVKKLFTEVMVPGAGLGLVGVLALARRRRWREDAPLWVAAAAVAMVVGAFASIPFHKARYVLPAVPFLALLAAAALRELRVGAIAYRASRLLLAVLLVAGAILSAIPQIDFTTKKDREFLPLVAPAQAALSADDTLLVGGLPRYTAQQVVTWYFDRPLRVEIEAQAFGQAWATGRYSAGLLRGGQPLAPEPARRRSGAYRLFLGDAPQDRSGERGPRAPSDG